MNTTFRLQDKVLNLYVVRFYIPPKEDIRAVKGVYYEGTATVLAFNPEQAMSETKVKIKKEYSYLPVDHKVIPMYLTIQNLPIAVGCNITSLEPKKGA